MNTTDLGIVPGPKPGPVVPQRVPTRGAGVSDGVIEMRSRLMFGLIDRGIKDEDTIVTLMDRLELGPDFDTEEDADVAD